MPIGDAYAANGMPIGDAYVANGMPIGDWCHRVHNISHGLYHLTTLSYHLVRWYTEFYHFVSLNLNLVFEMIQTLVL